MLDDELPSGLGATVAELGEVLDKLGRRKSWCQHGDYCLNNLLVEVDDIHIIDFENFGMNSMLFHDEITFGLSMYARAPKSITTTIQLEYLLVLGLVLTLEV